MQRRRFKTHKRSVYQTRKYIPVFEASIYMWYSYTPIFEKSVNKIPLLIDSQTQVHSGELLVNQNIKITIQ